MRYIARSRTTASKVRHFRAGSLAAAGSNPNFCVTGEPIDTQIVLRAAVPSWLAEISPTELWRKS
jgi:hypothetical protein